MLSSTRLTLPLLVVSLRWDADVRCYPQRNRGRRLTKIGAMYKYTPAESNPEGARVWEHTCKHKVCLSAFADAGDLERGTREPKEREYKKNGRSAIHIYIYMSGKSPGKMSRQTNRSVQTHYFKFKHQIKPPVTNTLPPDHCILQAH